MESEKNSKSAKGEAASTAQWQFIAERDSGTPVGSAEGIPFSPPSLYILFIFSLRTCILSLLRSPFSHHRSTFGFKSFQINRSVCQAELLELSSVDGRETGSGEILFCL
ncbi:hypothetical protein LR48_Vigan07g146500 [Vigna angularis]|uniref:Uncharacterized protein n=1 Tax=Phaseolus angularis TaxID=3914 RepID=A0A0L9UYI9_PHAAN|nr:hypothetical protein LR48_Vigan07g146500 [Vigna angularis]